MRTTIVICSVLGLVSCAEKGDPLHELGNAETPLVDDTGRRQLLPDFVNHTAVGPRALLNESATLVRPRRLDLCVPNTQLPIALWDAVPAGEGIRQLGFERASIKSVELHAIAIQGPGSADIQRYGLASVRVTRKVKPLVLVLSAFHRTAWTITADPGVSIERIVLFGFGDQTAASAPAGVPVDVVPMIYNSGPSALLDCEMSEAQTCSVSLSDRENLYVGAVEQIANLPLTSFVAYPEASEMTVGQSSPSCDERPEPVPCTRGCKELPHGDHVCTLFTDAGPTRFSLETGTVLETLALDERVRAHSVTQFGDKLVGCQPNLFEADLATGSVLESDVHCQTLTARDGSLFIAAWFGDDLLVQYDSFSDAVAGREAGRLTIPGLGALTLVSRGDVLFSSRFGDSAVGRYRWTDGSSLGDIVLDGYPGGPYAITSDDLIVVAPQHHSTPLSMLQVFDGSSGVLLKYISAPAATGIVCD